jgi:uncharacterized protein YdaU (DUF1376 family)
MGENPWFKFWARDFLTDPDVDNTPDSAMLLVIKMWCVCCIEGSCPADPEEIARKTRVPLHRVSHCYPHCQPYFEERDGRLYSRRMEKEKAKSAVARTNAEKRYGQRSSARSPADGSANGSAIRTAQKARKPESQKAEGSVHVVGSVEGSAVVGPVETVEIVENVPEGTPSLESLKKKSEAAFHIPSRSELERRAQEQKQKLHEWQKRKGNSNPNANTNTEFKLA